MTTFARRRSMHRFARALLRGKDNYAHYVELGGRLLIVWDTRQPAPQPVSIDQVIGNRRVETPPDPATAEAE